MVDIWRPHGPRVALAQIEPWTAMLQFAAALTRRGVQTIRHAPSASSTSARARLAAESLSFTEVNYDVDVAADGEVTIDAERLLSGVIDVQASERIWDVLVETPAYQQRPDLYRSKPDCVSELSRKDLMYAYLADYDVPVPMPVATVNDVPQSWPVIIKRPVGYGGVGVRLVKDAAELTSQALDWHSHVRDLVIEPVLDQPQVNVGGVADGGEIIVAGAYRPTPPTADRFGPPISLEVVEHPEAMAVTARTVAALGLNGPFCLNMMTGPEGLVVIDVNVRIFGSWLGLQRAGYDLLGAYLWRLGLGPAVASLHRFRKAPIVVDFDGASWRGAGDLLGHSLHYVGVRGAIGEVAWALAKHRYG